MNRVAIFTAGKLGNTERIAQAIAGKLGSETRIAHISEFEPGHLHGNDLIILGCSTVGEGQLPDGWQFFFTTNDSLDWTGVKVALFGLGDQAKYPETFVDGMGEIYEYLNERGAEFCGLVLDVGYEFEKSRAVIGELSIDGGCGSSCSACSPNSESCCSSNSCSTEHSQKVARPLRIFCGLPVDEDNQPQLTDARIDIWLSEIANDFV